MLNKKKGPKLNCNKRCRVSIINALYFKNIRLHFEPLLLLLSLQPMMTFKRCGCKKIKVGLQPVKMDRRPLQWRCELRPLWYSR